MLGFKFLFPSLLLCALPVLGDDTPAQVPDAKSGILQSREWQVGGTKREALVFIPAVPRQAPVIFVWHGHGGTTRHASNAFALHKLWPEAIVVYPQGLPTPGKIVDPEGRMPGWQFNPGELEDRDFRFFDAMLATLERDLKSDPKRVYVTGHSNGGRFVYVLWAARAEKIAAFAPSASPATGLLFRMPPKPCLHIAGETDRLVPFASQQRTMEKVRALNHCQAEGRPWGDSGAGRVTLYPSPSQTPFISAIYPGGHTFPKEAPRLIAEFFKHTGKVTDIASSGSP